MMTISILAMVIYLFGGLCRLAQPTTACFGSQNDLLQADQQQTQLTQRRLLP
jgi:hypothetical protein